MASFVGYFLCLPLGLKLVLDVNKDSISDSAPDGVGMRVLVHSHSEMPFPDEKGIPIAPGQFTYIGLKAVSIIKKKVIVCFTH